MGIGEIGILGRPVQRRVEEGPEDAVGHAVIQLHLVEVRIVQEEEGAVRQRTAIQGHVDQVWFE